MKLREANFAVSPGKVAELCRIAIHTVAGRVAGAKDNSLLAPTPHGGIIE